MTISTLIQSWKRYIAASRTSFFSASLVVFMTAVAGSLVPASAQSDCSDQACRDRSCKAEFAPSIQENDFAALSVLLEQRPLADMCSPDILDGIRLVSTKRLARHAHQVLAVQGPDAAEDWLAGKADATFTLASNWQVNVVRGEIEASRKQWLAAARQFETSYDLYLDELETQSASELGSDETARRLYLRAMDTRHLAGTMEGSISRSGEAGPTLGTRGYVTQSVPMPIQFESNSADIKTQGYENIDLIIAMIEARNIEALEVIGHTDWYGTPDYNNDLSLRRANAVATAIGQKLQRPVQIRTRGMGEDCPRIVSQLDQYTRDEVAAMYRRVSLAWPRDVNSQLDDCDPDGIVDR